MEYEYWIITIVISFISTIIAQTIPTLTSPLIKNEKRAAKFLEEYDRKVKDITYMVIDRVWNFETNITEANRIKSLDAYEVQSIFDRQVARNASQYDCKNFKNKTLTRMFQDIVKIGPAALSEDKYIRYEILSQEIEMIYNRAEVCNKESCYELRPDLERIMGSPHDPDLKLWAWEKFRDAVGPEMRLLFADMVKLSNDASKANGLNNMAESWLSLYEVEDFEEQLFKIYDQLREFYEHLHAYVRKRLREVFGKKWFPKSGHIPAHLLGRMSGTRWDSLEPLIRPYPEKSSIDITNRLRMKKTSNTPYKLFRTAEKFYTSLGFQPFPARFWRKSMIEKPIDGRRVDCHPAAWNLHREDDVRIKMCTEIDSRYFQIIHHELGHIVYFLEYQDQPVIFRTGANPGFHEAIGDTLGLSAMTPAHLHKTGLLPELQEDEESDINFLMAMALEKVAFLPAGLMVDLWRWKVFRGEITSSNYNKEWWKLRCNLQGVFPPVKRTENDFDPANIYHVAVMSPYVRYFVATILQFQFQKALCDAAGNDGPLHRCDIGGSKQAGRKLREMMQAGASKPWPDILESFVGTRKMDAGSLVEYFQPLMKWLKKETKGEKIGWDVKSCPNVKINVGSLQAAPGTGSSSGAVSNILLIFLCFVFTSILSNKNLERLFS